MDDTICTHPADRVGKLDVRVSEVSRTPARDGLAYVLLGTDEDSEDDEQC